MVRTLAILGFGLLLLVTSAGKQPRIDELTLTINSSESATTLRIYSTKSPDLVFDRFPDLEGDQRGFAFGSPLINEATAIRVLLKTGGIRNLTEKEPIYRPDENGRIIALSTNKPTNTERYVYVELDESISLDDVTVDDWKAANRSLSITIPKALEPSEEVDSLGRTPRVFTLSYADPGRLCLILNNLSQSWNTAGLPTSPIIAQPYAIRVYDRSSGMLKAPEGSKNISSKAEIATGTGTADEDTVDRGGSQTLSTVHLDSGSAPFKYIIVRANEDDMKLVETVIHEIDKKSVQIRLDVKVCEVSSNALNNLGLDAQGVKTVDKDSKVTWSDGLGFTLQEDGRLGVDQGREFEALSFGDIFRFSGVEVKSLLVALVQSGQAQILAAPNLTAVDTQLATYFAGERVPYSRTLTAKSDGTLNPATIAFENVGVELQFYPRVNKYGDTVTMRVVAVISSVTGFLEQGDGSKAPRVAIRKVESVVRVRDNEPFILAGMIKDEEVESIRKLPGFSEIPILGKLFRHKSKTKDHTELCVFVTPHIICDDCDEEDYAKWISAGPSSR